MHAIVLFSEGGVPIDLIRERVPGKAHDGNAIVPDAQDVRPFLPKPLRRFVARRPFGKIGLSMHHRQFVAIVVLIGEFVVAEHLAGRPGRAIISHAVLVGDVVVVAHDAVVLPVVLEEKMVFLARHAVIHQVLVHFGIDAAAIIQIE